MILIIMKMDMPNEKRRMSVDLLMLKEESNSPPKEEK